MKLRVLLPLVVAVLLAPGIAHAAQIYGSLKKDGRSITQQTRITIDCESGFRRDFTTDRYGAYRVFVPQRGRCTLTVTYRGDRYEQRVHSYDTPVRYDFELVRQRGGFELRRK